VPRAAENGLDVPACFNPARLARAQTERNNMEETLFTELNFQRRDRRYTLVQAASGWIIESSNGDSFSICAHPDGLCAALIQAAEEFKEFREGAYFAFAQISPRRKRGDFAIVEPYQNHLYRISRFARDWTSALRDDGLRFVIHHQADISICDAVESLAGCMDEAVRTLRLAARMIRHWGLKFDQPGPKALLHTLPDDESENTKGVAHAESTRLGG
jgi:hypothetical protein